jgi:hypothetical protein
MMSSGCPEFAQNGGNLRRNRTGMLKNRADYGVSGPENWRFLHLAQEVHSLSAQNRLQFQQGKRKSLMKMERGEEPRDYGNRTGTA